MKLLFRLLILVLILSFPICLSSCLSDQDADDDRLIKIDLDSKQLKKQMQILVWLPEMLAENQDYPVLYFLPDGGGSAHTVIHDYLIGRTADELVEQGVIEPMIIVAVSTNRSFCINSAAEVRQIETASGTSFVEGPYEDYLIKEVIPMIDEQFPTKTDRSGRMIGGYSMGGYAALHLAFRNPQLFSRAGGHSASLFPDSFPDESISDWLYPDELTRDQRDPIRLAQTQDLSGLSIYLDTGQTDVNLEGNALLAQVLEDNAIPCVNHIFSGSHGRYYCQAYMSAYLEFYGKP
ncbi:MAG: alpha/beta hydrolase-fold protein [Bacillota bacterium]|nr:alpha/beta hydrolase-fold protein [Bacillota bacterium]